MWPCFSLSAERRNFAHIIGVTVRDTSSETAMATLSVTANSRNKRPTMPPIISNGNENRDQRCAHGEHGKADFTGALKRRRHRGIPSSMWRVMFSSTTMASSTTKPVEMASAIRERLSRL